MTYKVHFPEELDLSYKKGERLMKSLKSYLNYLLLPYFFTIVLAIVAQPTFALDPTSACVDENCDYIKYSKTAGLITTYIYIHDECTDCDDALENAGVNLSNWDSHQGTYEMNVTYNILGGYRAIYVIGTSFDDTKDYILSNNSNVMSLMDIDGNPSLNHFIVTSP